MAETHELRLKINAAAARAGAKEFVSSIRMMQEAVDGLDAKSSKAFDRIDADLRSTRGALSGLIAQYNSARSANERFAASIAKTNKALARQISLAGQTRMSAPSAGGSTARAAQGAGQAADQQISAQNRVQRAVDNTRLSVERLTTSLMKVGGFQSVNELGAAYRRFQKEISGTTVTAQQLDSAKTRLNTTLKSAQTSLVTLTAKAQENARAEREAAVAARSKEAATRASNAAAQTAASTAKAQAAEAAKLASAQLSAASAMRSADQEAARLTNRLRAMGDTRGIANLSQSLITLRSTLNGSVTSTLQVRQAMSQFAESTNRAKLAITKAEGAKAAAAKRASELAAQERKAANAARQLEAEMRSAAGAANASSRAFRNATGNLRGLENAFSSSFHAGSLFRTMIGSITLGAFTQSVFRAGDALEQFKITMEVASGSAEAAASDLGFIDSLAADLGTNLGAARDAFSKFAVASDIAGVSGTQTRDIFESVATAMSVMGRGTEDQRLAFLALEQMMSKGVISAEELRRQLGERLPGAVSLMAEAVGVSVGELQKMLKNGELLSNEVLPKFAKVLDQRFGSQLERTFNRAGSNLGRFQVELQKLLEVIANSGFLDELAIQFRDLTTAMRSEEVQEAARTLGRGFAEAAEVFGEASLFIINNLEEIGRIATLVIGTLVARQFFALLQSATMGAQGMLAAAASFLALRKRAVATTATMGAYGAAAATATASTAALGAGAATTAGRLTSMAGVAAGLGRVFGAMTGPIGLVISALTLVPTALDLISSSVEDAAFDYGDAIREMETTTFRFLDRARDAQQLSIGDQLAAQADKINEAQKLLAQFRGDEAAQAETSSAFDAILSGGVSESVRKVVGEMKDLNAELLNPATSLDRVTSIANDLKKRFVEIRNAVPEDQIRRLEESMLPSAKLLLEINATMGKLNDTTAGQAQALVDANAQYELANNNVRAIREGLEAVGDAPVSPEIKEFLASQPFGGVKESVELLGRALANMPNVPESLVNSVDQMAAEFEDGTLNAEQFRAKFEELRPSIDAAVTSADNYGAGARFMADNAEQAADSVDVLSNNLVTAEGTAYAAESGIRAAEAAALDAADAGYAGADGMNALGAAFNALSGAGAAASAAIGGEIAKVQRQIELRSMNFVDRQVGQAMDRQQKLIKEQRANIDKAFRTELDAAGQLGGQAGGFMAKQASLDRDAALATLDEGLQEYQEAVRTLATTPLNNEGRPTTPRKKRGGGGGRKKTKTEIQEEIEARKKLNESIASNLTSLEEENTALALLSQGFTNSQTAAKLMAEAMRLGGGAIDEQTLAMIRQIEMAEKLKMSLERLANDPVNDWMNSVPTWREAGQQIETGVFESLSDTISNFIKTGEFSFQALGDAILGTVADIIADKAVKELATLLGGNTSGSGEGGFGLGGFLSDLFGNGGSAGDPADPFAAGFGGEGQGAALQNAVATGGTQAAESIRTAMLQAGQQLSQNIATGGSQAGTAMQTSVQTGGSIAGSQMSTQTAVGGTIAGTQMNTQTTTGGQVAASSIQNAMVQGGAAAASQIGAASAGGGGGGGLAGLFGGGGGIGGMLLGAGIGILGSVLSNRGNKGPSTPEEPVTPVAVRQFAEGTPNTSGIPAVLHPNEAVIPLSKGRKVPIEMNEDMRMGGSKTVNQTFNIQTPDADSFRKSQKQIAADAASSGRRAMQENG